MGFEIKYNYHPRKSEGSGYNEEELNEKRVKVGKPFDDTPLEKCAAAIMAQMARRDVWVVDVEVFELVKKEVAFKESKDGKGIVLKNKKFSLNQTAQMIAEDVVEETSLITQAPQPTYNPVQNVQPQKYVHPHEMIQQAKSVADDLYSNPNKTSVVNRIDPRTIDKKTVLYHVYYEPYINAAEAAAMKLKFTENKQYSVHAVIPSSTGKLDAQKIALTDDTGQIVILLDKFFTSAGRGLLGDAELGFSEPRESKQSRPRLAYEKDMHWEHPDGQSYKKVSQDIPGNIPLDDGEIPNHLLSVPNLRPEF